MQQRFSHRGMGTLMLAFCVVVLLANLLYADNDAVSTSPQNKGYYSCHLTVYMVEPVSRYTDYGNANYHDGFLNFAYDTTLNLAQDETFERSVIWDGSSLDITEDNIKAIAVVSNANGETAYSMPPSGYPFTAYYVDAAAEALPGETGQDQAVGDYTHTVFLIEGTQKGCSPCQAVRAALESITGENFVMAAMVVDLNGIASAVMANDYNLGGTPTVYLDGGRGVYGYGTVGQYISWIQQAGAADVADVDLSVSTTWLGDGEVQIDLNVVNHEFVNTAPTKPSKPAGPDEGGYDMEYTYTTSSTDLEGDNLYYQWDWGDGDVSEWIGPYNSGEEASASHSWSTTGDYQLKVRAKEDREDLISEDSPVLWLYIDNWTVLCGDANSDGLVDISDAVFLINLVFQPGAPQPDPWANGEVNCDSKIDVSDAVYLINLVFVAGAPAPCECK